MSQSKVNQITESEELFTTQDLIESTPLTEETAIKAHDVNMSEDLDFQPSEDVSTEVNKAIEPSEDFDVEQSEDFDVEPTEDESITETEDLVAVSEDLGAMNEDSEQVPAGKSATLLLCLITFCHCHGHCFCFRFAGRQRISKEQTSS